MRTNTEPGSFFAESSASEQNTFGITASTQDDLTLHVTDHTAGRSLSLPISQESLDEFESLIGVCRAWVRCEKRG